MSTTSALFKKHTWHVRNLGRIVRSQSNFKWMVVLGFAALFEGGMWVLFLDSFRFLDRLGGAGGIIIGRLFSLFFLGMGLMLVLSSLVTAYASVFRSEEIPFLLVRPFAMREIVLYKYLEASLLASWAFFFIIVPFVGSYAWHERASPLFAVWTVLFSVPFLALCSALGTLVVLLGVRWMPRHRLLTDAALVLGGVALLLAWVLTRHMYREAAASDFSIAQLVPGLRLSSNMLLPSAWVADGIVSLASGRWLRGCLLWGVLASSAAMAIVALEWVGELTFYEAWQRVSGSRAARNRVASMAPWLRRVLRRCPDDLRAMVVKDVRTFLRDPMQWSQALIFFGMLALYFGNLRSFRYDALADNWRSLIAFLNVFSVSAVVCSFGSRFVYPQISLEGHGFWVLGLSPTTLRRIVWVKFWSSFATLWAVSLALTLLSTAMLRLDWPSRVAALGLVSAVALAVSALSTGLGALYADLRQRNPAAIVSGFGGTLNLVLSLGFMLAVILPPGLLFHLDSVGVLEPRQTAGWLALAALWTAALTIVATVVPLRVGMRSLERRDF